jgi:hypothetical protein
MGNAVCAASSRTAATSWQGTAPGMTFIQNRRCSPSTSCGMVRRRRGRTCARFSPKSRNASSVSAIASPIDTRPVASLVVNTSTVSFIRGDITSGSVPTRTPKSKKRAIRKWNDDQRLVTFRARPLPVRESYRHMVEHLMVALETQAGVEHSHSSATLRHRPSRWDPDNNPDF